MRAPFLRVLGAALLLVPLAAEAGSPKGPFFMLMGADGYKAHSSEGIIGWRAFDRPVGVYQVHITDRTQTKVRPIDDCVAVASPAEGAIGTVGVEAASDGWSFFVWTTAGGALTDLPFYLVVHCPK